MMTDIFENASWIFAPDTDPNVKNRYFRYKTSFDVGNANNVRLYISAFSGYAVYINDNLVNAGQYEDYAFHPVYDELDITNHIVQGGNTLEILHYVCGNNFSTRSVGTPGIIFAVYEDNAQTLVSSKDCLVAVDTRFLPTDEVITGQLGYTVEYDANQELPEYRNAVTVDKPKEIIPRPVRKLTVGLRKDAAVCNQGIYKEYDRSAIKSVRMQTAFMSEQNILGSDGTEDAWAIKETDHCDGVYIIGDLGGENTGWLTFSMDLSAGTEVLIGFGEHLDDLRVRTRIGSRNFCFRYIAKEGENTFFVPIQRLGLRFIQLNIAGRTGRVHYIGIIPTEYPVDKYPCPMQDQLHKTIYDIACRTMHMCMHEHYEDCPWREQSQYAMDSRVQMLCGYYAFHEFDLPKASLQLMSRGYREKDHLLELCAPGYASVDIPSFTAVFTREVMEYVKYSRDIAFAAEMKPTVLAIANGFAERICENGLIPLFSDTDHWNFYEWRDGMDGGRPRNGVTFESPLNAFASDNFRCCALLCDVTGDHAEAEKWMQLRDKLNKAIHETFYDRCSGGYVTRLGDEKPLHTLTQGLMLFSDIVPDDCRNGVQEMIFGETLIPCSLSMTIYVYDALLKDAANREYVLDQINRTWGRMVLAGADTFWETELGADDFQKAGSMCHGWSSVPVYIFGKYFAEDVYKDKYAINE